MSVTKNKKMIIKGAGKFMVKLPNCDEMLTIGTLNNMKLDIQLDMVDIEGGDSKVPLDSLLRKKMIDVSAESAKFDLNMVRLVTGSKLNTVDGYVSKTDTKTISSLTASSGYFNITTSFSFISPISVTVTSVTGSAETPVSGVVFVDGNNTLVKVPSTVTGDSLKISYIQAPDVTSQGYIWVLEEKHDIADDFTVSLDYAGYLHSKTSVSVRDVKANKLLKQVSSAPTEDQYTVSDSGVITFNSALAGKQVYVNYKKLENVDVLDLKSKDLPLTVQVVYDGHFEQKDGSIQGIQVELYACRVKSNFTIDAARGTASTHNVQLTVIDPERSDDKLGTIKRYELANVALTDLC